MQKKASGPHPAEHPTTIITIMTDRRRTSGNDTAIINDHGINNDMTSTDDNDSQRTSDYQIHPEQSHNSPSFVSQFSLGNEGKEGQSLSSQTWPGSPRRPSPRYPRPPDSSLEFPSRVQPGLPKPYSSRYLSFPEFSPPQHWETLNVHFANVHFCF